MGEFRIGRSRAQHSYPNPRAIAGAPQSLIQVGSDLLTEAFAITPDTPLPLQVGPGSFGPLLQVPLNDFRRVNGLWLQFTVRLGENDSPGDIDVAYFPWVKFSSLPQTFFLPNIAGSVNFTEVVVIEVAAQPYSTLSVTLDALVQLPAASSDPAPIAFPAVDDILVGVAAVSVGLDFEAQPTTIIAAGEMNASIITQIPQVVMLTLVP